MHTSRPSEPFSSCPRRTPRLGNLDIFVERLICYICSAYASLSVNLYIPELASGIGNLDNFCRTSGLLHMLIVCFGPLWTQCQTTF
ncbi:hypothetical protein M501DRAFT_266645 [Patellaria atrata CBS 101060]|uniref:Uncharacterized protein n=1 Tax=Patellaria atrata CBS 101060 TaxID=1346257 RepID=A0A9P4S6R4_9PEZI|nr:hypothetical protein M501DRAFT_266645 [Patellaria atrata CBS 101060]